MEELLRTALSVGGAYISLLDEMPEDAFPGEDQAAVLLEMFAGSAEPALRAAGEEDCRRALALIAAVQDRVLEDLRAAALLARESDNLI